MYLLELISFFLIQEKCYQNMPEYPPALLGGEGRVRGK